MLLGLVHKCTPRAGGTFPMHFVSIIRWLVSTTMARTKPYSCWTIVVGHYTPWLTTIKHWINHHNQWLRGPSNGVSALTHHPLDSHKYQGGLVHIPWRWAEIIRWNDCKFDSRIHQQTANRTNQVLQSKETNMWKLYMFIVYYTSHMTTNTTV